MKLFTQAEELDEKNPWFCNTCKKHKQATKEMSIYRSAKYVYFFYFDIRLFI
jgi:ubiquitin C-terminal hydrolase